MGKKTKIMLCVTVCLIWNLAVLIPFFIMRSQLKFPTLNLMQYGWLIPLFMTMPFVGLFFGLVSIYRKKILKWLASIYIVFGILFYSAFLTITTLAFTTWYPHLYPMISETNSISDYLIIDDTDAAYERIVKIMPQQIPTNAQNVTYNYRYVPLELDYSVNAQWNIPEADYEAEKQRVKDISDSNAVKNEMTICTISWSMGVNDTNPPCDYSINVEFYDETNVINYTVIKNSYTS